MFAAGKVSNMQRLRSEELDLHAKHAAELAAGWTKHAAELAALHAKHSAERAAAHSQPTAPRWGLVNMDPYNGVGGTVFGNWRPVRSWPAYLTQFKRLGDEREATRKRDCDLTAANAALYRELAARATARVVAEAAAQQARSRASTPGA